MTPEARAREQIDNRLRQSGWTIQDLKQLNLTVASGVAVREFPTNICAQHLIEKITPNILLAQMQENTSILSLHIWLSCLHWIFT